MYVNVDKYETVRFSEKYPKWIVCGHSLAIGHSLMRFSLNAG